MRRRRISIFERHPYRIRFLAPVESFQGERFYSNILLVDDTLAAYRSRAMTERAEYKAEVSVLKNKKWIPVDEMELNSMVQEARFSFSARMASVEADEETL